MAADQCDLIKFFICNHRLCGIIWQQPIQQPGSGSSNDINPSPHASGGVF
jgi:hypothetical protein